MTRIPNLTRAVERAGVLVVRFPGTIKDHDSYASWPDFSLGGRPVIALTGGHPGDRDRFNVGHELGHLLLHTLRPNTDPREAEAEANRFAGALLLPRRSAAAALRRPITLRVLMGVKATYGISIAMGAQRARDLELISKAQFVSLRCQRLLPPRMDQGRARRCDPGAAVADLQGHHDACRRWFDLRASRSLVPASVLLPCPHCGIAGRLHLSPDICLPIPTAQNRFVGGQQ